MERFEYKKYGECQYPYDGDHPLLKHKYKIFYEIFSQTSKQEIIISNIETNPQFKIGDDEIIIKQSTELLKDELHVFENNIKIGSIKKTGFASLFPKFILENKKSFHLKRIYKNLWYKFFTNQKEYIFSLNYENQTIEYFLLKKEYFDKNEGENGRTIIGNFTTKENNLKTALIGLILINHFLQQENEY